MNQKTKNGDTPYYPTTPVQDQFNQLIVSFGISKKEKLAVDLFLKFIDYKMNTDEVFELIEDCNNIANTFCNWEKIEEVQNKIIM